MGIHNKEFGSRTLGVDREQVDLDILQIKKEQTDRLEQINKQIEALKLENENLRKHCDSLKNEIKTEMKPVEFMEYALKKADEYTPLFDKAAQREIEDIISIGEKTEILFNRKIAEFEEKIKETQGLLDNILKDVLHKNEYLAEKVRDFIEKEGSHRFIPERQNRSKSGSEKMREAKKFTDILEKSIENKNTEIVQNQEQNTVVEESRKIGKGNLEDKNIEESPLESPKAISVGTNRTPQSEEQPVHKLTEESKSTASDISNIRSKYLIGKLAGADLVDKNGRTIVTKGAVITNEIVDKAEKEGKLAELIVNMTLPDV